jgi:uncharacterized protein with beta-barrel porin domain
MKSHDRMKGFPKNLLSTAIIMAMIGVPTINAATVSNSRTSLLGLSGTDDLTVTDTGSISIVETSTQNAVAAYGDYSGNILNDGIIAIEVSSDTAPQSAYGIYLTDALIGTITNNGSINATASSDAGQQMYAYGISIDWDDITGGSITNTGEINASVQGGTQSFAYGIKADDLSDATFINSGSINISGSGQSGDIFAYALYFEDLDTDSSFLGGDINIDIEVDNNNLANAVGLQFDDIDGSLNMDGNINIDSEAGNGSTSIDLLYSEYITGSVTHSGASELNAYSQGRSFITGFSVQSGIEDSGSILNSGLINLTAESTDDNAQIEVFDISSIFSSDAPTLHNSGTITANATGDDAIVYGFSVHDDADNTLISNSGTIQLTATADNDNAEAAFYFSDDELAGDINNSGDIIVTAITEGDHTATAYGAYIDSLTGSITNSSNISINAQSDEGNTYSRGFLVGEMSGSLSNSGDLSLSSTTTDGLAYSYGISGDDLTGSMTNSGNITLNNTTINDAFYAYGVELNSIYGHLYNNGTIALQLSSTESSGSSYAYGLLLGELDGGNIENNGSISLQASATDRLSIYGANLSGFYDANFSSDGSINIIASADDILAYGIRAEEIDSDSTLSVNDISVNVTGDSATSAYAVYTEAMEGDLNAEGTLSVTGTGSSGSVYLYAMHIDGETSGNINHSGNTTVSGQADQQQATSYGIRTSSLNGSLTQSGSLNVNAQSNDAAAYAYGIRTLDINDSLNNSGDITVSSQSDSDVVQAYGMRLGDVAGPLSNSGTIVVQLESGDEDNSSLGYGISLGDLESGSLFTNDGSIRVEANITDNAFIYGINLDDISNSSFSSSGDITVTASADELQAYGIYAGDIDTNSTFTLGNISVTAEANSSAAASGININSMQGTLTLNGDVSITNYSDDAGSETYGIYVDGNANGNLINNGTINVAASAGDSYALYLGNGTGTITNNNGANISGSIYTGGSIAVTNEGNINLAANDSVFINGDFTQTENGILQLDINGTTTPQLTINGTATFAANSILSINSTSYTNTHVGDSYNDIVSAGTLTASDINVTDNSALLDYAATVDGNSLDIEVTVGQSFSDITAAHNITVANSAAAYWDNALNEGANTNAINEVLSEFKAFNNSSSVATALFETLPHGAYAVADTTIRLGNTISDLVNLRQLSDGDSGITSADNLSLSRDFWIKPFSTNATQDNNNSTKGYEADTYGIASGVDTLLNNNTRLGAAFFYSKTDIDINDINQRSEIESYQLMAYGSHPMLDDATQLNWQAGIGYHQTDSVRAVSIINANAAADYNSWSAQLAVSLSRDIQFTPTTRLQPELKAMYQHYRSDAYSETGAEVLSLNINEDKSDRFMLGIGMNIDHQLSDKWLLNLNTRANIDLLNNRDAITSTYAGDSASSFDTEGIELEEISFTGRLGLAYQQNAMTSFELIYNTDISSGYDNQLISAKFLRLF